MNEQMSKIFTSKNTKHLAHAEIFFLEIIPNVNTLQLKWYLAAQLSFIAAERKDSKTFETDTHIEGKNSSSL